MSNRVISILMKRDGYTLKEAMDAIAECKDAILNGEDYAIEDYLGLEDDYLFDILGFIG